MTEIENNTLIEIYRGTQFALKLLCVKLEAWDLETATELLKIETAIGKKLAKMRPHT